MTLENFASLGLGFIAINIKTPLDGLQSTTPIQSLITQDVHEIFISVVKIVLVCVIPYLFNKIFTGKKKESDNSNTQPDAE